MADESSQLDLANQELKRRFKSMNQRLSHSNQRHGGAKPHTVSDVVQVLAIVTDTIADDTSRVDCLRVEPKVQLLQKDLSQWKYLEEINKINT